MSAGRDSCNDITDAARAEFDIRGYAGARIQRIADAAGVNKQLIFYYHGSKLGLFRNVVRASLNELAAATAEPTAGPQATKRLRQQVANLHCALAGRPHLSRLLTGDAALDPEAATLANSAFIKIVEGFANTITDGQRLGYFRDDCDAETSAGHAVSLILGHLMLERATPKESRRVQISESISRLVLKSLEW